MWFNSIDFLWFILIVLPIYYALGAIRRGRGLPRVLFLLVASYFFYMYWNPVYILLIVASTVLDYFCGLGFLRWPKDKHRLLVTFSVCGNLGILAFFKYGRFFYQNAQALGAVFGWELPPYPSEWDFALPVGISFYTFQTMSYTIDLYRGKTTVETSFWRFALFVAYFPQLVAGPIERARHLIGEIKRGVTRARPVDTMGAIQQISYGLFKKVAVADSIGILINPIFANPDQYSGAHILTACILFSFQIYGDFSGYSDIAIGIAKLFGIRISTNFFFPYFTTNITRFWRTWHMSLSSWLKEYLYITLGGNRKGRIRTYANLLTTMLLGGLWHGASWNFVLWGFLHGLYLAIHRIFRAFRPRREQAFASYKVGRGIRIPLVVIAGLFNFLLVALTWIPFRCAAFSDTATCLRRIFTCASVSVHATLIDSGQLAVCWLLVGLVLLFDAFYKCEFLYWQNKRWPVFVKALLPAIFVLLTIIFGATEAQQFIYFQF
ncbi:MAG: MBOAT family O-acyltransferase [Planctomycetota bacterium]|jgi:D-alanyl-lipoteichoic acid acyltransferase DltB (MBOAT superfamily)